MSFLSSRDGDEHRGHVQLQPPTLSNPRVSRIVSHTRLLTLTKHYNHFSSSPHSAYPTNLFPTLVPFPPPPFPFVPFTASASYLYSALPRLKLTCPFTPPLIHTHLSIRRHLSIYLTLTYLRPPPRHPLPFHSTRILLHLT